MQKRKRNLLLIYYPSAKKPAGSIEKDDIDLLYNEFTSKHVVPRKEINLDIILHSLGGDPGTAYRMAQLTRYFSVTIDVLIPEYAYSAATLFSFSADTILMTIDSCISPIDIAIATERDPEKLVESVNIDYFIKFVEECRKNMEKLLEPFREQYEDKNRYYITNVDEHLLRELVNQVGALKIGGYFRARMLTAHYARVLLEDYLLMKYDPSLRKELTEKIIHELVFECPSHQFEIDFQLANKMKLPVKLMDVEETQLTKNIIFALQKLELQGDICQTVRSDYRMPFFRLYRTKKEKV